MIQMVNKHYRLMRFVEHFFLTRGPTDREIQLGRQLHAAFTLKIETDRNSLTFMCVANTRRHPSLGSRNLSHGNRSGSVVRIQQITVQSLWNL